MFGASYHVNAMVHTVYEIHIGRTSSAEHDFGTSRTAPAVGVAAFVFCAAIAFCLHNPAADLSVFGPPDKMLSQKKRSGLERCELI
ncbi:hypothetical protein D3C81_1817740 [compost metagenome]